MGCILPSLPVAQMTLKRKRRGAESLCMRSIILVCLSLMSSNGTAMGQERRSREDHSSSLECSCTLPTTSWGELLDGQPKKQDKYCCLECLTTAPKEQTILCQDRLGGATGLPQLSLPLAPFTGVPLILLPSLPASLSHSRAGLALPSAQHKIPMCLSSLEGRELKWKFLSVLPTSLR